MSAYPKLPPVSPVVVEDEPLRRAAASVAHDLRTPLAGIQVLAERARRQGWSPGDEARIAALCAQAIRLTTEMVTIARGDAVAGPRLDLRPCDLVTLVREGCAELELSASRPPVLDLRPASAMVDPVAFRRLLGNLVANAVRHGPRNGAITVSLRARGAHAVVEVRDAGRGPPADEIRTLFEPWRRGSNARRSGSGLGLYIVRELVEAHGGTVSAQPVPGGFCMRVVLPIGASGTFPAASPQQG